MNPRTAYSSKIWPFRPFFPKIARIGYDHASFMGLFIFFCLVVILRYCDLNCDTHTQGNLNKSNWNRKMVNTFWFQIDLTRFRIDFCLYVMFEIFIFILKTSEKMASLRRKSAFPVAPCLSCEPDVAFACLRSFVSNYYFFMRK